MEAAQPQHLPNYYRVNRAIHDRINAIAGNPILTQTYRANMRLHALRFRSNLNAAKWNQAVAEHRDMMEALAERDGAARRDILVRHLKAKLQAVLETMKNKKKPGDHDMLQRSKTSRRRALKLASRLRLAPLHRSGAPAQTWPKRADHLDQSVSRRWRHRRLLPVRWRRKSATRSASRS